MDAIVPLPGDWATFLNEHVRPGEGIWGDEQSIYLGHGKYFAHPFGEQTEQEIVGKLNQHRIESTKNPAGIKSAKLSEVKSLDYRKLKRLLGK